ncbi:MAG: YHS domain-containing (seleno)protein [Planctomycetota bacterium]|jgi:uncharacterized protein YceK|nr:YHS domain-containing (seleno)protein [Planctomycetota bacterium]
MRVPYLTLVLAVTVLLSACASARDAQVQGAGGLALTGYDPVAYHDWGRPKLGDAQFSATIRAARYHFLSASNRSACLAEPERYLPALGGWCAWSLASDNLVTPDPTSFLIVDGRLLLFSTGIDGTTRRRWQAGDSALLLRRATAAWNARQQQRNKPAP